MPSMAAVAMAAAQCRFVQWKVSSRSWRCRHGASAQSSSRDDLTAAVLRNREENAANDERRRQQLARILNPQGIHCTPDSTILRNAVERQRS